MSRRQIPLKSQYPTLLSELPVWVRRLAHFALIVGASVLVANALVGENGLVDALGDKTSAPGPCRRPRPPSGSRTNSFAMPQIGSGTTLARSRKSLEGNSA